MKRTETVPGWLQSACRLSPATVGVGPVKAPASTRSPGFNGSPCGAIWFTRCMTRGSPAWTPGLTIATRRARSCLFATPRSVPAR